MNGACPLEAVRRTRAAVWKRNPATARTKPGPRPLLTPGEERGEKDDEGADIKDEGDGEEGRLGHDGLRMSLEYRVEFGREGLAALGRVTAGGHLDLALRFLEDGRDLARRPVEGEEEPGDDEERAEPDEVHSRVLGRFEDGERGGLVAFQDEGERRLPLGVARPEIRVPGEHPAGEDPLLPFPGLDEGGRVARLLGAALDLPPFAEDEIGDELADGHLGDPGVVDGGALAELERHRLREGRVGPLADLEVERGLLPVPTVARLIERDAPVGQRVVDLDDPGEDGRPVLDHGDRALPVFHAALRVILGLELVQADAEGGLRDVGRLAFEESDLRAAPAEPAGEAAGEDDEQAEMDDIGAEEAQAPFPGPEDGPTVRRRLGHAEAGGAERGDGLVLGRGERERQAEPALDLHGHEGLGIGRGSRAESPAPFRSEPDDRADDEVQGEEDEEREVPGGTVEPGQLERREEPGQAAVAGGVLGRRAALGNEGAQDRGQGDEDDQDDGQLDRREEFHVHQYYRIRPGLATRGPG